MDECKNFLGETQIFLTLDANFGYTQIEMNEKDVDRTGFVTPHGPYICARVPFRSEERPRIMSGCNGRYTSLYQVAVYRLLHCQLHWFLKLLQKHIEHENEVLELLQTAGMKLKVKTCKFFQIHWFTGKSDCSRQTWRGKNNNRCNQLAAIFRKHLSNQVLSRLVQRLPRSA